MANLLRHQSNLRRAYGERDDKCLGGQLKGPVFTLNSIARAPRTCCRMNHLTLTGRPAALAPVAIIARRRGGKGTPGPLRRLLPLVPRRYRLPVCL